MIINFKGIPGARQSYCDYIDKNLTYHLYLHYHDDNKEVFRVKWDGTHYLAYNIWRFTYNGGWSTNKEIWFQKPDLQRVDSNHTPGVYIAKHYCDKKEIIKKIPQLKYVWPDKNDDLWSFIHIIINYPEMELIYKNLDTRFLWKNMSFYRLGKETQKKVIKAIIKHDLPKYADGNLSKILFYLKHPTIRSELQYEKIQAKEYFIKHIPTGFKLDKKYVVSRYYAFDNKDIHGYGYEVNLRIRQFMDTYKDYLTMMKKLEKYVPQNLYPRDVIKAHDELVQLNEEIENKRLYKLRIISKNKIAKLSQNIPNSKFELYLPQTQGDLVDLGKKFDNCVGSAHYGEDEKKGKCLICALKTGKIWVACVEIDLKTRKIHQIYGKHNSTLRSNAPKMFINRYIREVVSNIC